MATPQNGQTYFKRFVGFCVIRARLLHAASPGCVNTCASFVENYQILIGLCKECF